MEEKFEIMDDRRTPELGHTVSSNEFLAQES